MGGRRAERQIAIGESPRRGFEAIVDYESSPDWQRAVRDCEVVSRDERGRGERVRFEIGERFSRERMLR